MKSFINLHKKDKRQDKDIPGVSCGICPCERRHILYASVHLNRLRGKVTAVTSSGAPGREARLRLSIAGGQAWHTGAPSEARGRQLIIHNSD